jgi:hypothetical protein
MPRPVSSPGPVPLEASGGRDASAAGRDLTVNNQTLVTSQAAAAPVALAHLPPLAAGFTGREAELARVAGLLNPAADAGAVVVSAVAGLAGVGKTALAVHAAHAAWVSAGPGPRAGGDAAVPGGDHRPPGRDRDLPGDL